MDSTKNPLIKSIQTIEKDFTINESSILEYEVDAEYYIPTTISDEEDDMPSACENIIENSEIIDILYDKHYFINRCADNKTMGDYLYHIIDIEDNRYLDPKFTEIQRIKFINIDTAKDKIDG